MKQEQDAAAVAQRASEMAIKEKEIRIKMDAQERLRIVEARQREEQRISKIEQ